MAYEGREIASAQLAGIEIDAVGGLWKPRKKAGGGRGGGREAGYFIRCLPLLAEQVHVP